MADYKQAPDFTVIKDTREQEGYHFSKYNKCAGMVERKLDTGDYSLEGMEHGNSHAKGGVPIFAGNKYNAFLLVSSIFKRVNEMYTIGKKK